MYISVLDYLKLFLWDMLRWKLVAMSDRSKVILILKEKCGNYLCYVDIDKNLSVDIEIKLSAKSKIAQNQIVS